MFCIYCGANNTPGSVSCSKCGSRFAVKAAPSSGGQLGLATPTAEGAQNTKSDPLVAGSAPGGSGGRAIAKGTAISEQQQPGTPHRPDSKLSAPAAHSPSKWRDIASTVCVVLVGLALLDAAVETYVAGAPIRLAVVLAVLVFLALLGLLWKRMQSTTKAISSLFFLLLLVGAAAWLPGGLERGIVMARQPTSAVLVAITGLAVLVAGVWFARLHIPWWLRVLGVALAAYGVAAFVLTVLTRQPYAALFHGQSFWVRAPFWLQGSYVGVAVIPLAIVANVITVLRERRSIPAPQWRWQLDLSLAIAVLIAAAAFVPHPRWLMPGGGLSSEGKDAVINGPFSERKDVVVNGSSENLASPSISVIDHIKRLVAGGELTDVNVALDENGGAIESISGTVDPSTQFYGTGFNGRRLIDGQTEPTWAGDPASDPLDPPHQPVIPGIPLEIVLSFYRHQTVLVGAVAITPGKDLTRAPKDVEIWVSNASPSDGFQKVGGGTLPPDSSDHQITFPPVEARYLKIRVLSNQQIGMDGKATKPTLEIAEIRLLEARGAGYVSIRDRNPDLPEWKGSPRYAAQHGIEWLQPAAVAWQKTNNCFGCHSQAQAVMGLAVATKNDYIVSLASLKDLTQFTANQQNQDGSFHTAFHVTATQFAAMELAYWDNLESAKHNPTFLKAVDWLLTQQRPSGEVPQDHTEWPIDEGSFMTTANSMVAFDQAFVETGDDRYKQALDHGLGWIISAKPETTQDEVFQILALSRFAAATQKPLIQQRVEQLIAEEDPKGGWREQASDSTRGPNAFATGQVLYAFKQAGVSITSSPFLKGVRHLLETQDKTGAWLAHDTHTGRPSKFAPSMWAIIGLAGSFGEIKTGGLQIAAETDPAKAMAARNLEIILDCSGSMLSPLGKSTRIGTARQVLRDVLAKIPDDFNVGLRVYANRYSWKDMQHSCTDTQLLLPIQKLDRQRILSTVDNLKPRGDTPLVYSVRQTPADLKAVGGGSVIVITDGQETCHGDPAKAVEELKASGFPVTLNIVGFTLKGKEKQDVERLMSPFAEATGGHYYYAENGEALARALALAALNKFPYEVMDSSGQQVAKGQAGPLSEALQPGEYKVVVHAGDQELTEKVTVTAKTDTVLKVVRKGNQFVLEHVPVQPSEPTKTAATGQGQS